MTVLAWWETSGQHAPMSEILPAFKYHPEPLTTGAIKASGLTCVACDRSRGYIYVGPVYAVEELIEELCPWCIADGSAARKFDAGFTDVGVGVPAGVAPSVTDEVEHRTPGFEGWQQEHWLYHCGDAAAFLGRVGYNELQQTPDVLSMLLAQHEDVELLDTDGDATAYLFRCLACGTHLAYADCA